MEMEKTNIKIKNLIKNAKKFEDLQFRLLLEELVKQGGREAEQLASEFVIANEIDEPICINIIRIMGYITSANFLMTLKRILEGDYTLQMRKAAIISISKYNDNRALNILNSALTRINNPILQDSISSEISRIKKDNPILSLLPKFLKGVDDPKTFRTTLDILKKILNPSDAQVFIYHLNSETPFVGDGAFEVLCWRGDDSVKFSIFDFFRKKLQLIDCLHEDECFALQELLSKLEKFITRNSDTINYILKDLKDIYKNTADPKVKDILINMLSSSHKREVLTSLEDIYNTEPVRREQVIKKLYGNEDGAYILIYKYKNDPQFKEKLIVGLMSTQTGADFILEIYDSLEPGYQQKIMEYIQISNYKFFKKLIERFLLSHDYGEKKFALDKIRELGDSRFQSILFAPELQDEFIRMQNDYIGTISQMYFIETFKLFINRIVNMDSARHLIRKYLGEKDSFILCDPIITLNAQDDLNNLAEKIVKYNNKDLNLDLLEIFCSLKTFNYKTYQKFYEFLETFRELRGSRISPEERGILNKASGNVKNINIDLKIIEQGNTNIKHFIEKEFPDYELLDYIRKTHHLSFFVYRQKIVDRIAKVFKLTKDIDAFDAIKFFLRRPDFCIYFKKEIQQSTKSNNYLLKNDADKLVETMPKDLRFVLIFENPLLFSCLENQLGEIMPEFEITRDNDISPNDVLLTDTESLKSLASANLLNTKKLYVVMKSKEEFADIKDLHPKVFPPPLSLNKILKAIIADMFPV